MSIIHKRTSSRRNSFAGASCLYGFGDLGKWQRRIRPPPGGTSMEWECAAGTRSLSEDSLLEASIPCKINVRTSASCCSATQPAQTVPPGEDNSDRCSMFSRIRIPLQTQKRRSAAFPKWGLAGGGALNEKVGAEAELVNFRPARR